MCIDSGLVSTIQKVCNITMDIMRQFILNFKKQGPRFQQVSRLPLPKCHTLTVHLPKIALSLYNKTMSSEEIPDDVTWYADEISGLRRFIARMCNS